MDKRSVFGLLCLPVVLAVLAAAPAMAVDAPKWVAAIYVEAQKTVGLRWNVVPGATAYKVFKSETSGKDFKEIASVPQTQYLDKAVEAGTTYFYVLQAVVGSEASPNSEERYVTIPGVKKVELKAVEWEKVTLQAQTEFGKTTYKVALVWKPQANVISYDVMRSTEKGKNHVLVASVQEAQYIDADPALEANKTYYYTLAAQDANFQVSPPSEEREVAVKPPEGLRGEKKTRKNIKLKVAGRASKPLWSKTKGDDNGLFAFWEPYDIEVDEARDLVYATSNNTQEVYVLKGSSGELLRSVGGNGTDPGKLLYPLGLGMDKEGNLYVADRVRQSVSVFSPSGSFVREVVLKLPPGVVLEKPISPVDVTVDPANGDLYVSDRDNAKVWVMDETGAYKTMWGEFGEEPGKLTVSLYLRFVKDGNLAIINGSMNRVDFFTKEGKYLRSWGTRGSQVGQFTFMGGFAFDPEGNFVIVDKAVSIAMGYLPDGRYLYHLANEKGDGGAPLFTPKGMVIDSKGRVFVAEGLVDRVQAFQITGAVPEPQEPPPGEDE
jgi:DNA-binding beta-propeller fold protein YncE